MWTLSTTRLFVPLLLLASVPVLLHGVQARLPPLPELHSEADLKAFVDESSTGARLLFLFVLLSLLLLLLVLSLCLCVCHCVESPCVYGCVLVCVCLTRGRSSHQLSACDIVCLCVCVYVYV